jgi:DNA-binding transcriptional LysR family regulator
VTVQIAGPLAANNSEALRDAALSGLGIALLPDFSAQAALQAGKLVQVLPGWQPVGSFAGRICAIRPYSAHVPLCGLPARWPRRFPWQNPDRKLSLKCYISLVLCVFVLGRIQ